MYIEQNDNKEKIVMLINMLDFIMLYNAANTERALASPRAWPCYTYLEFSLANFSTKLPILYGTELLPKKAQLVKCV